MINQVLILKFKPDAAQSDIDALIAELFSLEDQIKEVLFCTGGPNTVALNLNKGFSYVVNMQFNDESAYVKYLTHPAQQTFRNLLAKVMDDLIILNYKETPPKAS